MRFLTGDCLASRVMALLCLAALACMAGYGGAAESRAQDPYAELALRHGAAQRYHEALVLPGEGGRHALVVTFRVPNTRLVFVQNRPATAGRSFVARAEVTVQLYRDGRLVGEQAWRRAHYAATFEETQRRDVDLVGALRFSVPPGTYGYRMLFAEADTEREQATWLRRVEVPDFRSGAVGGALLLETPPGEGGLAPLNLGGDLAFSQPGALVVPLTLPAPGDAPPALRYTLRRVDPDFLQDLLRRRDRARAFSRRRAAPGSVPLVETPESVPDAEAPALATGVVERDAFRSWPAADSLRFEGGQIMWPAEALPVGFLVPIPVDVAALAAGTYLLDVELSAGGSRQMRRSRFATHWRDMPISLHDARTAIRHLEFIEDRATIKQMLRGGRGGRSEALDAYWARRDPTPGTPYNELMAEYYRRIDHAADAFRTGTVPYPDGLGTDQARIYVVHGPPDRVERRLAEEGGVEEVWTYADGRPFVFWAAGSFDVFRLRDDLP